MTWRLRPGGERFARGSNGSVYLLSVRLGDARQRLAVGRIDRLKLPLRIGRRPAAGDKVAEGAVVCL